jgi:hypothetical protein
MQWREDQAVEAGRHNKSSGLPYKGYETQFAGGSVKKLFDLKMKLQGVWNTLLVRVPKHRSKGDYD